MDHYIKIGEMVTGENTDIIRTVVGSCISLCIWDELNSRGGMVHIMLPLHDPRKEEDLGKYADTAVPSLISLLQKKGSMEGDLVAKIAGGASMFGDTLLKIGERNTIVVKKKLNEHGIPIRFEDVGGCLGRNVVFSCQTGEIVVRNHKGLVLKG